jgi:hypothetical protein
MQRIQNVQTGKEHQKKRHLAAFVFVPFVYGEEFPTAEFGMTLAETSYWEVERK